MHEAQIVKCNYVDKAYYENLKFFKSRLVTKQSKLKLYRTVIRPIVTYASETWVLKETIIQKLLVIERKILRRIFGPTKENQIWRVKTNEELDKPIKHKNIINHIKAQRLTRGRPGAWETDLVHFIINGNINLFY